MSLLPDPPRPDNVKLVDRTFSVNTLAHFWTIKAFLPAMSKAGHGHIVNMASFLGTIGVANLCKPVS